MAFHHQYIVEPAPDSNILPMSETIDRIRAQFPNCVIDPDKGKDDTETRLAALTKYGAPQQILESYRYPGVYCYIRDDDDANLQIECMVWPMQPICVVFATPEHEMITSVLLQRLADCLGYVITLDQDAA